MKTILTCTSVLLVLAFTQNLNAQTYVNAAATGNNDGTSWADAYTTLHDALENYSAGDEIWVAAGTYLPGQPSAWPGDPENTFYIYQDLKLYGGFDGTETMLSERDPATNVTTLSGDLNGDDVENDFETNREDNATSVVLVDTVITAATFIDGFTIRGGHAAGDTNIVHQTLGGGMMAWGAPQIAQCHFTQNYATVGGGLFLESEASAETSVTDCIFENNEAADSGGGMVVATGDSSKVVPISNCQFIGNHAVRLAGGFGVRSSSVALTGCSFTQNSNEAAGGGIFFFVLDEDGSDYQFSLTECDFTENVSANGGAFYYETNALGDNDLTFTSCNFTGNQAVANPLDEFPEGGALEFLFFGEDNTSLDSIIISECIFQENTTERLGGGIVFWNGQGTDNFLEISNSTFTENSSVTFGGGIHLSTYGGDHMEANITECEFANNSSTDGGGVSFFSTNGEHNNFNVTSCDFTGNQATELAAGNTPDGGGIYVNFQNPGDTLQFNTVTVEDCTLQGNSAEQRGGGILLFNNTGNDNSVAVNNCQLLENTSANAGGGVYFGNFGATNLELSFFETDFTDNSSNHGGASYYFSTNGDNNSLLFSDCNFTGNTAITSPTFQYPDGGALGFQYGDGVLANDYIALENCVLENNLAERFGGGIAFFNSHGTDNTFELSNCQISDNTATIAGGGVSLNHFVDAGATQTGTQYNVVNTDFENNTSANGGGFHLGRNGGDNSELNIVSCDFTNNKTEFLGNDQTPDAGAILIEYFAGNPNNHNISIEDCLIQDNSAASTVGGLFYIHNFGTDNHFQMDNCQVIGNSEASGLGVGGVGIADGGTNATALIRNTHFSENTGPVLQSFGVGHVDGVPFPEGADFELVNCLFTGHNSNGPETAVVGTTQEFTLTNCTISDNQNPSLGTSLNGKITLQNTILDADGFPNLVIVESTGPQLVPPVSSLGGNLINDAALDTLLNSTDQSSADPLFGAGTFELSQNSPAVDAGTILDNTSATDLAGNDRIQGGCIDIGAYESPHDAGTSCLTTDSREVLAESTTIFIYPNPVSATASISIEGVGHLGGVQHLNLRIVNVLGQTVYTADFEKFDQSAVLVFDASDLPEGVYRVMVSGTGQSPAPAAMAVSSFVKI